MRNKDIRKLPEEPKVEKIEKSESVDANQNVTSALKPELKSRPIATPAEVNAETKKSNTVKEIEAIQQRREERRAAQQKARVSQNADIDPSNPNYELLKMIREFQSTLDFQTLMTGDPVAEQQICVCVRKRPMNRKELGRKEIDVITVPSKEFVIVHEPRVKVDLTKYLEHQHFRFDYAFDESADNKLVYWYTARPLVRCIFEKGMATCFAYGQTGSGKTHTMGGEFQAKSTQNCREGIYALAAEDVFTLLDTTYAHEDFTVEAAFFEIYGSKVFDLLNDKTKLRMLEDASGRVQIVGLRTEQVFSVDEVLRLLEHGTHIRTSGQTSANQHSSRSHAVFQIILLKNGRPHGKFSLIDLAGNERGADTSSANRVTRMEGAEINKSLLALKECIRALGRKGAHLPFRGSKLTQVLRDSFTGDRSRTCMIAMISPSKESCEHTLNTLRYADRVKELGPNGDGKSLDDWKLPLASNRGQGTVCTQQQFASAESRSNTQLGRIAPAIKTAKSVPSQDLDQGDINEDEIALLVEDSNGEIAEDVLKFHQTHKKVEKLEEQVCQDFNELSSKMKSWAIETEKLSHMINQVEYDPDTFINSSSTLIKTLITELTKVQGEINSWKNHLNQEDELLAKMHHVTRRK
ncbi:Kinesin-like protein kif2a [Cichlidogyrus casuarinus]|uniref:Kinesin-like protein n=1 Tax=Cichlidogyrus casuarinus TaxID=1844966 RepID=A0ABD2QFL8_9PLAT